MSGETRRRKIVRSVNAEQVNDRAKLMIHRIVARRMASDPLLVDQAREALSRARAAGDTQEHTGQWENLLARDPAELRRMLTARTDEMYRLRNSSPLALVAGMEDPVLRRRIWRKSRDGLAHRAT